MSDPHLVSIVVPARNAERFVARTIESILQQTYRDWELLVVIDGSSTDRTETICRKHADGDARIHVLTEGTLGVSANRNLGIERAKGEYLCFLDSDDWWHFEKLARQLDFMRNSGATFSYTAYDVFSEDGASYLGTVRAPKRIDYSGLMNGSRIGCLTVMIKPKEYPGLVFRNENHEDFALWLRVFRHGAIAYGLDERLACYRRVRGSRSNNKILAAMWRWQIYRGQEKVPLVRALIYFYRYFLASGVKRRHGS